MNAALKLWKTAVTFHRKIGIPSDKNLRNNKNNANNNQTSNILLLSCIFFFGGFPILTNQLNELVFLPPGQDLHVNLHHKYQLPPRTHYFNELAPLMPAEVCSWTNEHLFISQSH